MKRYVGTLALMAVAALLALYVVLVDNPRERAKTEQQGRDSLVVTIPEAEVTALEITTQTDRLRLERRDGAMWRVSTPVATEADEGTVRRLLTQLSTMSIVRSIEGSTDDAETGLASPSVQVVVHHAGGRTGLAFGGANPTESGVYVRRDDGKVFLVETAVKSTFEVSRDDVRRKEFVDFKPESVTDIVVTNRTQTVRVRRDGGEWLISEPPRTADPEKIASLLSRLRALRATGFIDDAAQRQAMRLPVEPSIEIRLGASDPPVRIAMFDAQDGAVYAESGGPTLYKLSAQIVKELPLDASSLRDMRLVKVSFDAVTDVQVERGHDGYRVSRRNDAWELDGRALDPEPVRDVEALIRAATSLRGESIAAERASSVPTSAFSSPEARITLMGAEAKTLAVITIGEQRGEQRYAYSNPNGPVFLVSSHILEQIPNKASLATTPNSGL